MKKILIVLTVLIAVMLCLSWLINHQKTPTKGILTVIDTQGIEHVLSQFPQEHQEVIQSKGKSLEIVPLSHIFNSMTLNSNWQSLTFFSSDGAQLKVSKDEYNSLFLTQVKDGEGYYLRLVIPTDDFSQRWLKYINRIQMQ